MRVYVCACTRACMHASERSCLHACAHACCVQATWLRSILSHMYTCSPSPRVCRELRSGRYISCTARPPSEQTCVHARVGALGALCASECYGMLRNATAKKNKRASVCGRSRHVHAHPHACARTHVYTCVHACVLANQNGEQVQAQSLSNAPCWHEGLSEHFGLAGMLTAYRSPPRMKLDSERQ